MTLPEILKISEELCIGNFCALFFLHYLTVNILLETQGKNGADHLINTSSLGLKLELEPNSAFRLIHVAHTEVGERHMHIHKSRIWLSACDFSRPVFSEDSEVVDHSLFTADNETLL